MTSKATKDGGRALRVRVRKKGLKASSANWLTRQLNDPYVAQAKREGYRSRAAFKLAEIDDKFRIFRKNATGAKWRFIAWARAVASLEPMSSPSKQFRASS
jgi:hypothetical protein